jgi:hypothetical protein
MFIFAESLVPLLFHRFLKERGDFPVRAVTLKDNQALKAREMYNAWSYRSLPTDSIKENHPSLGKSVG